MAIRNPWVLPVAALMIVAALGFIIFFGGNALHPGPQPQPATNILRVPGNYPTIQEAIDAARPGGTVEVAPGTYDEDLLLNKPITLAAEAFDGANAANNNVILDGGSGQAAILVPGGVAPMPVIRGFVLRNGSDGIAAHSPVDIQNDYFYGSQMLVEYATGGGGINRSNVYFNAANDAVHIDDLSAPLLIQNNRFLYAGDDAIEVDLQATSRLASPLELDIWDNLLIGSSQDGIKLVDYSAKLSDTNRRIVVAGNLIANNRRAGIGFMHSGNTNEDYSGTGTRDAVRVYNDTFYGNNYGISGGTNLVAFNDIIAGSTSRGAWRVQGAPSGSSVIAYTLFFANPVDMDQTQAGAGDILGQDPLFAAGPGPGPDGAWGTVDDDFNGLVLRPGSPAIDKGVTQYKTSSGELVPPSPLTGYTGAAPDLGWRELGSTAFVTPVLVMTATAVPQVAPSVMAPATATVMPTGTAAVTPSRTGTTKPGTTLTPGLPAVSGTPVMAGTPEPAATLTATGTPTIAGTPMPIIQAMSPTSAKANTTLTLTITGSGFQDGAMVSFEGSGTTPRVNGVQFVDPTTITVNVTVPPDTDGPQVWNLRLTNPDSSTALLLDALTVTP